MINLRFRCALPLKRWFGCESALQVTLKSCTRLTIALNITALQSLVCLVSFSSHLHSFCDLVFMELASNCNPGVTLIAGSGKS